MVDPAVADPEAEFLASKQETGIEWELFKENVRPLKRGRNVHLLNRALRSNSDLALKRSLLETRRKLIDGIEKYEGDDPLQPWLECIKWVQESFPSGGESSGLVVIYEQCVRKFWHNERYKDDLRYLKVWIEYAENCADADVIFRFLEANEIGQNHSIYYYSYAWLLLLKNKVKKADEIFRLGIARKANPFEKLEAEYKKFILRSSQKNLTTEDNSTESHLPVRSFGTVLDGRPRNQSVEHSDFSRKGKLQKTGVNKPLSIYTEPSFEASSQSSCNKNKENSWYSFPSQSDRNKENSTAPTKWTSYKVPQNQVPRSGSAAATTLIEVLVDEEYANPFSETNVSITVKPSVLQLRQGNAQQLMKETELLKENPLRNFPMKCLR